MGRPTKTHAERLAYMDANTAVNDAGCWVWTSTLYRNGYGKAYVGAYRKALAHCVAYRLLVGPVPSGLQLDHVCRNRACCNPSHLEPVTSRVNTERGNNAAVTRARHAARTHCLRGHAFTTENTWTNGSGARVCRTCKRAHDRKRKDALKATRRRDRESRAAEGALSAGVAGPDAAGSASLSPLPGTSDPRPKS